MSDLNRFIRSFLRLQSTVAKHIKLTKLNKFDSYRLIIYSHAPHGQFLPTRVNEKIHEIVLKNNGSIGEFDGSIYPNLKKLTIEGNCDFELFILKSMQGINSLSIDTFDTKQIKLDQPLKLLTIRCTIAYFQALQNQLGAEITEMHLQFNQEVYHINLRSLKSLERLSIRGRLETGDAKQFNQIIFPTDLQHLKCNYMLISKLNLKAAKNLDELIISNIRGDKNRDYDTQILWPFIQEKGSSKLKSIRLNGVTLSPEPVTFSNDLFLYLQELEFESHMNEIIVVDDDLPNLKSLRTSVSRYTIGHDVKLYLLNCKNLQKIRTSHRIEKLI